MRLRSVTFAMLVALALAGCRDRGDRAASEATVAAPSRDAAVAIAPAANLAPHVQE
jgi:hypothetical protein